MLCSRRHTLNIFVCSQSHDQRSLYNVMKDRAIRWSSIAPGRNARLSRPSRAVRSARASRHVRQGTRDTELIRWREIIRSTTPFKYWCISSVSLPLHNYALNCVGTVGKFRRKRAMGACWISSFILKIDVSFGRDHVLQHTSLACAIVNSERIFQDGKRNSLWASTSSRE